MYTSEFGGVASDASSEAKKPAEGDDASKNGSDAHFDADGTKAIHEADSDGAQRILFPKTAFAAKRGLFMALEQKTGSSLQDADADKFVVHPQSERTGIVAICRGTANQTLNQLYGRLEGVIQHWAKDKRAEGGLWKVRSKPEHSMEIEDVIMDSPFNGEKIRERCKGGFPQLFIG